MINFKGWLNTNDSLLEDYSSNSCYLSRSILEVSDNLYKFAEELGSVPREEVQKWISAKDPTRNNFFDDYKERRTFTALFGWSVPCKEAVEAIKKYAREPLYDLMAGTGYWSRILKKAAINVQASDIHKQLQKNYYHQTRDETGMLNIKIPVEKSKIRRKNALRVAYDLKNQRIKGDIFLSWPPYQSSFATDVLKMIPIGSRVFYIGEPEGGCTGDASLCRMLDKNFKELHFELLPRFSGINDYLSIYEKIKDEEIDPKYRGKV